MKGCPFLGAIQENQRWGEAPSASSREWGEAPFEIMWRLAYDDLGSPTRGFGCSDLNGGGFLLTAMTR